MPPMHDGAAFEDHFSAQAGEYARCRPQYPAALFDWLASVAPACGDALDVGAGNGQAAWGLARHFRRVRACEPSPAQLAAARAHPRIEYVCERAEAVGVPDCSYDLVTAAQAAHWFDWARFRIEVRRVLRPHGVAAVWSYGRFVAGTGIDEIVDDFYRNVIGPYWPRRASRGEPCRGWFALVICAPPDAARRERQASSTAWTPEEVSR